MATQDKYDRQLRLWGPKGQKALGDTTVVLLRATAAGTETLKNLVLPGIGNVLLIDDAAHVNKEYTSNFFLVADATKPRAQVAWELLSELNDDVKGQFWHVEEGLTAACSKPEWWTHVWQSCASTSTKVLVVASDLEPPLLQLVSAACASQAAPLISIQSYGLLGMCRLQTPPLPILDPKPTNAPPDLRLRKPFERLQQLADGVDWAKLESHQHSHVPYPLILIKLAKEWKDAHSGALPKTQDEKQEFRKMIQAASRNIHNEVNFEEAMSNAYLAYTERSLDLDRLASLRDTLNGLLAKSSSSSSTAPLQKFSAMLHALDSFMKQHDNEAPLHGTIPDMTASTDWYVELQRAYHEQAAKDLEELRGYLPSTSSGQVVELSTEELTTFCQNVHAMELFQTRTIVEEMTGTNVTPELQEEWMMATMDPYEEAEHTPILWWIGFRACQVFYESHGRYPGVLDAWEDDIGPLQVCIGQVVQKMGLQENELIQSTLLAADDDEENPAPSASKFAQELARYGQCEIHAIASLVGGVASQEAVKIITGQYVPFNNTYIYNGIVSVGATYEF